MKLEIVTKVYDQIITDKHIGYRVTNSVNDEVTFVPKNVNNSDYQAIQEWAAIDGNNIVEPGE